MVPTVIFLYEAASSSMSVGAYSAFGVTADPKCTVRPPDSRGRQHASSSMPAVVPTVHLGSLLTLNVQSIPSALYRIFTGSMQQHGAYSEYSV